MDGTIREVTPGELCDAVAPGEVTLVLGAPRIGKSHHLRTLGPTVERLTAATAVDDDELVIVDDFVSAVGDGDENWSSDGEPSGIDSLFARPGGAVLVTRPRSLDWLYQRDHPVSSTLVERVDSVVVVRVPPSDYGESFYEIRETIYKQNTSGPEYGEDPSVVERVTYPSSDFENEQLQEQIGTIEETVTPAAFLSLSKHGSETVLFGPDVRTVVDDCDVTVEPVDEAALDRLSSLNPRAEDGSRGSAALSPAVTTALALVASSLVAEDTAWLEPLVRHRPLAGAAEALELAVDLPPGTIEQIRVFASETMRTRIGQRLVAQPETETAIADASAALGAVRTAMRAVGPSLDDVAMGPDEYGSSPLVGAWHWEGPETVHAAANERAFPDADDQRAGDGGDVDEVVDALDDGLVVLSGPKASGKRRLAASVATELTARGATVRLPDLHQPDHIRAGIDATPDAIVVATYGAEPARITSDAGVRALVDWVAAGTCSGALVICDDERREQLDTIADRAGCADVAAWRNRVEFSLDDPGTARDRDPAALARDLLSAMDWPETRRPSRRTLDVERITDQSTLAAIVGIPDADLDTTLVGRVLAEAVGVVARTSQPSAATKWLALVDDLVGDVGLNRSDTDGAITFRGSVYGTAMAAVATEDPTTDEWVAAIADRAIALTNETATPHGRESVGGDREPVVSAFATGLATLARPGDGTGPNHAALACVDQVLHRTIDAGTVTEEPGLTLLCRIYGEMTARIVDAVDDPAAADDALAPVAALVQQAAATNDDAFSAFVIGNSFASTLGAVAGAADSADDLPTWVDALGSRVRESVAFVQSQADREVLLRHAYTAALGFWGFEFECPEERIEPWLVAVGEDLFRTATTAEVDDSAAFVVDVYGQAVRHVVGYRDRDRAELLFDQCGRLVDTIAASGLTDEEWEFRAALHAAALAAFADVEHDDADGVTDGPYGTGALPLPGSPGFEDWIALYDEAVRQAAVAEEPRRERARFLTAVYRGALSTQVRGFDDESVSGISPRAETTWFEALTDRIDAVAATDDLVDDPVAFLRGVFGGAAANWAADGAASVTQEWIVSLVRSLRECRWAIDGPAKVDWFDAFAKTDAAILRAVLTRTDMGELTHDRLVETTLSQIETAATAADNPPHPVTYVASVFGTALALAVEGDPAEVRFGVTEVVAAAEERADFEYVGIERASVFERIYARAFAVVGHSHGNHDTVEEWLAVVTEQMATTAKAECPEDPAGFVASVYTRAYVDAVDDGVEAWRRRLDAELRAFATGTHVEDPEGFLEEVYADVVVTGTTQGQPAAEIEACVAAVFRSVETTSAEGVLQGDDAVVRTFSRAVDTLPTGNPRAQADHTSLLGQALRAVGGEDLEVAVFDGDCQPGDPPE